MVEAHLIRWLALCTVTLYRYKRLVIQNWLHVLRAPVMLHQKFLHYHAPTTVSSLSYSINSLFSIMFHQWFLHYCAPHSCSELWNILPIKRMFFVIYLKWKFFFLLIQYNSENVYKTVTFLFPCSEDVACTCEHVFYSEIHKWSWSGTRENQTSLHDLQAYFKECTPHVQGQQGSKQIIDITILKWIKNKHVCLQA